MSAKSQAGFTMSLIRYLILGAAGAGVLLLLNYGIRLQGPDVVWQETRLEKTLHQGDQVSEDIGFISNRDLENINIWVAPEIEKYLFARPLVFDRIQGGSVVRIQVIFIIPNDLAPGTYDGTIHIRKDRTTIARPLPVVFTVAERPSPSPSPSPQPIELFYDDGTAEGFDFDPVYGRAVFFTKFVASGETVKILGAKIFLKIVNQPPSPIDLYLWDADRQPLIPPVRFTPTESGWSFVDVSSYNLIVSSEFYIGIAWPSAEAPPLLGVDFSQPQGKSFVVILSTNTFIPIVNSNLMIRAVVEKL